MSNGQVFNLFLLHAVQVSILAILVSFLVSRYARNRAHLAHLLWALVLLKCITPPLVASPASPFSWIASWAATPVEDDTPQRIVRFESSHKLANRDQSLAFADPLEKSAVSKERLANSDEAQGIESARNEKSNTSTSFNVAGANVLSFMLRYPWTFAWAASSTIVALVLALRLTNFLLLVRRLKKTQDPSTSRLNQQLQPLATRLAKRLRIRRQVEIQVVDALLGPAIIGLIRPTILLPRVIAEESSREQLKALIGHELVHLRRGDLWWSAIQALATALSWWNPLAWWAARRFQHETERCCDEETVASLRIEPRVYARVLLDVLERKTTLKAAPLLPGVRPVEVTAKRLERIMRFGQGCRARAPRWAVPVLLLGCCICLPGAAFTLAQEPVSPQERLPKPKKVRAPNSGDSKETEWEKLWFAPKAQSNDQTAANPPANQESQDAPAAIQADKVKISVDMAFLEEVDLQVERFGVAKVLERLRTIEQISKKEAKQMLLGSLHVPSEQGIDLKFNTRDTSTGRKIGLGGGDPKAKIVGENLYVLGSKKTLEDVKQHLNHVAEFGLSLLQVDVQIIEMPTARVAEVISNWGQLGQEPAKEVVPASFSESKEDSPFRMKLLAQDSNIQEMFQGGNVLSTPKITIMNGMPGTFMVGSERPFVTDVEIIRSGGKSAAQPKIEIVVEGIEMEYIGKLGPNESVALQVEYRQSKIESVDTFTFEKEGEEVTVQQPVIDMNEIAFTASIPTETYLAVSGRPQVKEHRVEQGVPFLSKVPYVNRLFKNVGVATEQVTPIFLIRCKKVRPSEVEQKTTLKSEDPSNRIGATATAEPYPYYTKRGPRDFFALPHALEVANPDGSIELLPIDYEGSPNNALVPAPYAKAVGTKPAPYYLEDKVQYSAPSASYTLEEGKVKSDLGVEGKLLPALPKTNKGESK
ncbi:MAG: M56 family metallopeptidase [Planctomycetota bacterium]